MWEVDSGIEERFRAVEIQVAVLKESMDHIGKDRDKNLATKADISALRGELKEDIGNLKDRAQIRRDYLLAGSPWPMWCGGDGGNRTRVRNMRPETSTSLVDLKEFQRVDLGST